MVALISHIRYITVPSDNTGERSQCTDKVPPKSGKREKLVSAKAAHQKYDCPTLENQPESLINEAVSIDDSFVKLTRNDEPNNL